MSLNTTFNFDPWEHFRVIRSIGRGTPTWWLVHGLAVVLPAAFLVLQLLSGEPIRFASVWFVFIPPVLILIVTPLLQLRAAFAHRTIHGPPHTFHGLELNDRGMRAYCDHTSSDINWAAVLKAEERTEFFLLYYAKNRACYLPKRAIRPEQLDVVRALLQRHLGSKARVGSNAV